MVLFHRFVLEDDARGDRLIEIAIVGLHRYELSRRGRDEPRLDRTELASLEAARKSLDKRRATLVKQGYYEDGTREGELPPVVDRAAAKAEDAAFRAEHRARFQASLGGFVEAWQAAGYRVRSTFVAEGARLGLAPVVVAEACLALAEAKLGARFARRRQGPEGEHGKARSVPIARHELATFYGSPSRVAALASGRVSAGGDHDGVTPDLWGGSWDGYGAGDEIAATVAAISGEPAEG